jgi:hypothetical protein
MAVKLGTSNVTLKLGTQSVTGYLGSAIVTASVPGAPTGVAAQWNGSFTQVVMSAPASDGGSEISEYRVYINAVLVQFGDTALEYFIAANYAGQQVTASAVNAVGEGPQSDPFTVVDSG